MKPTIRRWVYAVAGVAALAGAGAWVAPINALRESKQLIVAPIEVSAAPNMSLPIALAGFRAIIVDYLWLRATRMKDEGRHFEAMQDAKLICSLQPRFAAVWAFHAWNMAYNISVTFDSAEERWRWVKNGIDLLRNQGIPNNPHNTILYKELAWIFFHKVGDNLDDQHWYYKNQFAIMMEDILGMGECDDERWKAIAESPKDWKTLVSDPDVAALVNDFASHDHDVSEPHALLGLLTQRDEARRLGREPAEPPRVWSLLDDPARQAALKKLEFFWRRRQLWDEMKVDAERVVELRKEFGPLDFRLADAHGLYWANMGVTKGLSKDIRLDIDMLNSDRIQLFVLQRLYRQGKLVMSPEARTRGIRPLLLPNTGFIKRLFETYLEISKRYTTQKEAMIGPVSPDIYSGFNNFMRAAIVRLYEEGDRAHAEEYFEWMRKYYDHEDFQRGLDPFVTRYITEEIRMMTPHQAEGRVHAYLLQSFGAYGYGADRDGLIWLRAARMVCDEFNKTTARGQFDFEAIVRQMLVQIRDDLPPEIYQRILNRFEGAVQTRPADDVTGKP